MDAMWCRVAAMCSASGRVYSPGVRAYMRASEGSNIRSVIVRVFWMGIQCRNSDIRKWNQAGMDIDGLSHNVKGKAQGLIAYENCRWVEARGLGR